MLLTSSLHVQAGQPDERVSFIHRSESRYPDVKLRQTCSVAQNRATIIAGSGVNPIDLDHGSSLGREPGGVPVPRPQESMRRASAMRKWRAQTWHDKRASAAV